MNEWLHRMQGSNSVSFRLFSPPSLVAVFPGPKKFRSPLCGGQLGPHSFSRLESSAFEFCANAISHWLGSQFATFGSQFGHQRPLRGPRGPTGPSEAPLGSQLGHHRPLSGPRGPSEAPLGSQCGPQRLWVSFWAWEGGGTAVAQFFFSLPRCGGHCQLNNFLPQKVAVERAVYPPP